MQINRPVYVVSFIYHDNTKRHVIMSAPMALRDCQALRQNYADVAPESIMVKGNLVVINTESE